MSMQRGLVLVLIDYDYMMGAGCSTLRTWPPTMHSLERETSSCAHHRHVARNRKITSV
eukprot:m.9192 g.9192  ORF g.9192 m.9192 type:complete len:58 (-) comp4151_c0_seq2:562-735(-)